MSIRILDQLFGRMEKPTPVKSTWELVRDKYPVGKHFTHRGVPVQVIASLSEALHPEYWEPGSITVEYVDSHGVIRNHTFGHATADYLLSL